MSATRLVRSLLRLAVLAAVGCASQHASVADPGGSSAGGPSPGTIVVPRTAAGKAGSGTAADGCMTSLPHMFPSDGPCDDSQPIRGEFTLTPAGHYLITCDPQPLEAPGCKGVPNDSWNACALRRCAARVSYPKGCNVIMPTVNPHYSSTAFYCMCSDDFEPGKFQWSCPI
jgi:hypothetical protein